MSKVFVTNLCWRRQYYHYHQILIKLLFLSIKFWKRTKYYQAYVRSFFRMTPMAVKLCLLIFHLLWLTKKWSVEIQYLSCIFNCPRLRKLLPQKSHRCFFWPVWISLKMTKIISKSSSSINLYGSISHIQMRVECILRHKLCSTLLAWITTHSSAFRFAV